MICLFYDDAQIRACKHSTSNKNSLLDYVKKNCIFSYSPKGDSIRVGNKNGGRKEGRKEYKIMVIRHGWRKEKKKTNKHGTNMVPPDIFFA